VRIKGRSGSRNRALSERSGHTDNGDSREEKDSGIAHGAHSPVDFLNVGEYIAEGAVSAGCVSHRPGQRHSNGYNIGGRFVDNSELIAYCPDKRSANRTSGIAASWVRQMSGNPGAKRSIFELLSAKAAYV